MKARRLLFNMKGQSIVEIALITPLLLAALYIAFDFGIALFTSHLAQNAVREGTRIGAILPDDCVNPPGCTTHPPGKSVTTASATCPVASPVPNNRHVIKETCDRMPSLLTGATVSVTLSGKIGDECRRMITVSVAGSYNYGLYNLIAFVAAPLSGAAKTLSITRAAEARYELQPVTYTDAC
jgi:hypothetical protein